MNNIIERLTGVHVAPAGIDYAAENAAIEVLDLADIDAAPAEAHEDRGNTDPVTVVMSGAVRTIESPSSSWMAQRIRRAQGDPVQAAGANAFRLRLTLLPGATVTGFAPAREHLSVDAIANGTIPVTAGTAPIRIDTTAEVWVVGIGAALDCVILQEFADGAQVP